MAHVIDVFPTPLVDPDITNLGIVNLITCSVFYLPPLQKRTALEEFLPLNRTSSTHLLKAAASFFSEQKLNAITARATAEIRLELSWIIQ